jgi:CRISPR-associated endonuclease/helicase Cas3
MDDGTDDLVRQHWQPLNIHLRNVAQTAKKFAEPFGCGDEAGIAGLLHDLGKYADRFQARLSNHAIRGINHWAAGAVYAARLNAWAAAFANADHNRRGYL